MMKAYIYTSSDFENEVIDVNLCIEYAEGDNPNTINTWLKGFDDVDWEEAKAFATSVATLLGCEYIGEIAE